MFARLSSHRILFSVIYSATVKILLRVFPCQTFVYLFLIGNLLHPLAWWRSLRGGRQLIESLHLQDWCCWSKTTCVVVARTSPKFVFSTSCWWEIVVRSNLLFSSRVRIAQTLCTLPQQLSPWQSQPNRDVFSFLTKQWKIGTGGRHQTPWSLPCPPDRDRWPGQPRHMRRCSSNRERITCNITWLVAAFQTVGELWWLQHLMVRHHFATCCAPKSVSHRTS